MEILGYIASFFVAVSLLMSSFLLLRVLNLIGAIAFVLYGVCIGSIPIVITNGFITLINIHYLVRMVRPDLNGIRYVPINAEKRHQIDAFITHNCEDIRRFFPDFRIEFLDEVFERGGTVFLAIRGANIAGFAVTESVPSPDLEPEEELRDLYRFVATDLFPERSLLIPIDYIRRKYRGLGLFRRLYRAIEEHRDGQIDFLLATIPSSARAHIRFLKKISYYVARTTGRYTLLVKDLRADV